MLHGVKGASMNLKNVELEPDEKPFYGLCPKCSHDEFRLGCMSGNSHTALGKIMVVICTSCEFPVPMWDKPNAK